MWVKALMSFAVLMSLALPAFACDRERNRLLLLYLLSQQPTQRYYSPYPPSPYAQSYPVVQGFSNGPYQPQPYFQPNNYYSPPPNFNPYSYPGSQWGNPYQQIGPGYYQPSWNYSQTPQFQQFRPGY